jgi:predicted nucleic acid-binding protein
MNVFIDTHILLDVLMDRRPFVEQSGQVWFLAERGKIRGLVSTLSFANVYYMMHKIRGQKTAMSTLTIMRDIFAGVAFDEQILQQAIDAGFPDFEDAVQYFSALRAGASCLITRNLSHFPRSTLPILTPAALLASQSFD